MREKDYVRHFKPLLFVTIKLYHAQSHGIITQSLTLKL